MPAGVVKILLYVIGGVGITLAVAYVFNDYVNTKVENRMNRVELDAYRAGATISADNAKLRSEQEKLAGESDAKFDAMVDQATHPCLKHNVALFLRPPADEDGVHNAGSTGSGGAARPPVDTRYSTGRVPETFQATP